MQNWFAQDRENDFKSQKKSTDLKMSELGQGENIEVKTRNWKFAVTLSDLAVNEKVFLTGNLPELGNWDFKKLIPLEYDKAVGVWTATVAVPECDFYYRYVMCYVPADSTEFIIRKWETHIDPREAKGVDSFPVVDTFGLYNDRVKITTGWLTAHNLVQFKFMNNPLKLKKKLIDRKLYIKVTPVKLSFGNEPVENESSLSLDTLDTDMLSAVLVEVSTLDDDATSCVFQPQDQFGRAYRAGDIVLFNVFVPNPQSLAYLIDLYSYGTRSSPTEPPCHIGYTYVLPNQFKQSEGIIEVPVSCNVKHRPLGSIVIEYLIVAPMTDKLCNLEVSYSKHWDPNWTGLEVGHRGQGASFKNKDGNDIRENTVASLKKAAANGADLLEFDVQLSKDMIPVIYHDYHVCISMKRKKEVDYTQMLELPVKDLSLEHLQKLKVYHLVEGRNHETLFFDEDLDEHQPFPTLEHVLKEIDVHVGFNIELKWTMELDDGTFELNNPFDMNTYVDKVLEVVLQHGGARRIVFSCFNPDICTMVHNKQNKYPIMFLTVGITDRYQPYRDPRCRSIQVGVQSAISTDILGIVAHTEDLLRDPTQIKLVIAAGLVIFCWGDDNNDKETIKKLKEMGLHAVIYDKIDKYTTKEVKESIFLMEARESQRDIMKLAADSSSVKGSSQESLAPAFLDLSVRNQTNVSTATSLDSLESSTSSDEQNIQKRKRDTVSQIEKDKYLKEPKEPPKSFHGLFLTSGDSKKTVKKSRSDV